MLKQYVIWMLAILEFVPLNNLEVLLLQEKARSLTVHFTEPIALQCVGGQCCHIHPTVITMHHHLFGPLKGSLWRGTAECFGSVAAGEGEKLCWLVVPAVQRWKKTGQIIEKWLCLYQSCSDIVWNFPMSDLQVGLETWWMCKNQ
jgi:hypothetical protein